jgi:hypothetical protein
LKSSYFKSSRIKGRQRAYKATPKKESIQEAADQQAALKRKRKTLVEGLLRRKEKGGNRTYHSAPKSTNSKVDPTDERMAILQIS